VSGLALVASVVLGLAFLLAGGSKLAAGPAWPAQANGLGAPAFVVPVVPWLELVVGAALVLHLAAPAAAVVALVLLVAFTGLIARRLSQGERPPCACFGAWSATPIGPSHLLRNGALIVLAIVALAG
jgi:uncharacterized membrane protein YphA (DoxX/SURF4 family)